jgi:hypothetical protein
MFEKAGRKHWFSFSTIFIGRNEESVEEIMNTPCGKRLTLPIELSCSGKSNRNSILGYGRRTRVPTLSYDHYLRRSNL